MKKLLTLALVAGLAPLGFADSGQGGGWNQPPTGLGACPSCQTCEPVCIDCEVDACPEICEICDGYYGSWCAPPGVDVHIWMDQYGNVTTDQGVVVCECDPRKPKLPSFKIVKNSPFSVTIGTTAANGATFIPDGGV